VSLGLIIATVAIIVVEAGAGSSDMSAAQTSFPVTAETVGFWLSFAGFAIAMAIFPVHTWMLEAQSKASAGVATILSGTTLLLGAYGMMRISLVVFPTAAHYYSFAITGLAVVGAFWGCIGALRQDELRRFIGYMNVAQMSLVLLAIGAQTSVALVGAVLLLAGQAFASAMLTLVSGVNIGIWFLLYRQLQPPAASSGGTPGIEVMLLLCAAYVFGCAFRSFLPRADVQRICLFDTWLSSVVVGRSVATVAEICFAAQWAIILYQLGTMTGADTTLNAAWVIVPLILIAECFSWYAVLTTHYLGNAIENSIWAIAFFIVGIGLCRLLPEFDGEVRAVLVFTIIGIASYLAFLMTVDVPMYLGRWRTEVGDGSRLLSPLEGFRDVCTRWVVNHDLAEWKDEIAWMSLYFSAAVWASLALCVVYSVEDYLPRHRSDVTVISRSSAASTVVGQQHPVMARHGI